MSWERGVCVCVCVGYKAFAFVINEFESLSAVTMCPMAGKYRLANRLLDKFFTWCLTSCMRQWLWERLISIEGGPCCMVRLSPFSFIVSPITLPLSLCLVIIELPVISCIYTVTRFLWTKGLLTDSCGFMEDWTWPRGLLVLNEL